MLTEGALVGVWVVDERGTSSPASHPLSARVASSGQPSIHKQQHIHSLMHYDTVFLFGREFMIRVHYSMQIWIHFTHLSPS